MVLHHQCDGLLHRNGPNRSMATWAQTAVRQGFVVLLIDSLGPRDVDLVCLGPKNGVNFPRGVRDAMQAARPLAGAAVRRQAARRTCRVFLGRDGRTSRQQQDLAIGVCRAARDFRRPSQYIPVASRSNPKTGPSYEIVQNGIDRPILVLMGDKDTETPPGECVAKLQAAKDAGAPAEWHVLPNATHCWDCEHLNGFSKKDFRGTPVAYRYDAGATRETGRRIFEFLEKTWAAGR